MSLTSGPAAPALAVVRAVGDGTLLNQQLFQTALSAISGLLAGVVGALVAARSKIRELETNFRLAEEQRENEERAKNQLQYLNPLRVAAIDLVSRLENINGRLDRGDTFLYDSVKALAQEWQENADQFAAWANGWGQFSLATLYVTAVYFARASRIRTELPFVRLSSDDDQALLSHLERVRVALGGDLGIWESLQDSLGAYVKTADGGLIDYREFCNQLYDPSRYPWFSRMIEFYRDIREKTSGERKEMVASLKDLERFLGEKPKQTATQPLVRSRRKRAALR